MLDINTKQEISDYVIDNSIENLINPEDILSHIPESKRKDEVVVMAVGAEIPLIYSGKEKLFSNY